MSRTDVFATKLKQFDGLIRYAARRCRTPAIDADDLYQEGTIILDNMLDKYEFDPASDDFDRMFKTELWHGLVDALRKTKAKKRDFRSTSYLEDIEADDYSVVVGGKSPEDILSEKEVAIRVGEFLDKLIAALDYDSVLVLGELVSPTSWDELPRDVKSLSDYDLYERVPSKVPNYIRAEVLGMSPTKFKRTIRKIRSRASQVLKAYPINAEISVG